MFPPVPAFSWAVVQLPRLVTTALKRVPLIPVVVTTALVVPVVVGVPAPGAESTGAISALLIGETDWVPKYPSDLSRRPRIVLGLVFIPMPAPTARLFYVVLRLAFQLILECQTRWC